MKNSQAINKSTCFSHLFQAFAATKQLNVHVTGVLSHGLNKKISVYRPTPVQAWFQSHIERFDESTLESLKGRNHNQSLQLSLL